MDRVHKDIVAATTVIRPVRTPKIETPASQAKASHLLQDDESSDQLGPVTSARMASAIAVLVAKYQHHNQLLNSLVKQQQQHNPAAATSHQQQTPYLPKLTAALSPVKYGHQMLPYPAQNSPAAAVPSSSAVTASQQQQSMSSPPRLVVRQPPNLHGGFPRPLSRDQLVDKLRNEPFVIRRVAELSREGLWPGRRLPKVCERPRPRTHWDSVLQEGYWLAVDFHQERKWKKAAAKMLAESARDYVNSWAARKQAKEEAVERQQRSVARFAAEQIMNFWRDLSVLAQDKEAAVGGKGVDSEDEDYVDVGETLSEEESTIEEQEVCNSNRHLLGPDSNRHLFGPDFCYVIDKTNIPEEFCA